MDDYPKSVAEFSLTLKTCAKGLKIMQS